MNLEDYLSFIESYSNKMLFKCNRYNNNDPLENDISFLDEIIKYIDIKRETITEQEIKRADIYSIFTMEKLDIDNETKLLLTSIYLDVINEIGEKEFIIYLNKYNRNQPIFEKNDLFRYVRYCKELIDYDAFVWMKESNICNYNTKYFKADGFLRDELLEFISVICKDYRKFIRIHPYYYYDKAPPIALFEEALRPVDPNWIKTLNLFKGKSTGGHYILQPSETGDFKIDSLRFWDYKVRKIRSLEIHAQRNNSGNLSMMIEEIKDNPIYSKYYIAKCIHLDTDNEVGTNIDDTILNHIDLAINVYNKSAYKIRSKESLSDGRVVDATHRTHLVRLENVPFRTLINLSYLFFDNETLTKEWINEQFFKSKE